jgi:hypothetical protein
VLKVGGKNDLSAVCVSHFSLLFPDLVDFDFEFDLQNIGIKLQNGMISQ